MVKKVKKTTKERVAEEVDFCYCPRLSNSITNLIEKNPNGVDNERIAKVLLLTEDEVDEIFESALAKLRAALGVKND